MKLVMGAVMSFGGTVDAAAQQYVYGSAQIVFDNLSLGEIGSVVLPACPLGSTGASEVLVYGSMNYLRTVQYLQGANPVTFAVPQSGQAQSALRIARTTDFATVGLPVYQATLLPGQVHTNVTSEVATESAPFMTIQYPALLSQFVKGAPPRARLWLQATMSGFPWPGLGYDGNMTWSTQGSVVADFTFRVGCL